MEVVRGMGAEANSDLDRACCGRVRIRDPRPAYPGMPRARAYADLRRSGRPLREDPMLIWPVRRSGGLVMVVLPLLHRPAGLDGDGGAGAAEAVRAAALQAGPKPGRGLGRRQMLPRPGPPRGEEGRCRGPVTGRCVRSWPTPACPTAKGVLAFVLSRPPGAVITRAELLSCSRDPIQVIDAAVRELAQAGLVPQAAPLEGGDPPTRPGSGYRPQRRQPTPRSRACRSS